MILKLLVVQSTSSSNGSPLHHSSTWKKYVVVTYTKHFFLILTQYNIDVQPSIVMHWNTVNIANPMLSNDVIPLLGPCQRSRHKEFPSRHQLLPWLDAWDSLSVLQGTSASPSVTISSKIWEPSMFILFILYSITYNG